MEDKHEHHKTLDVKKRASASTEVGKSLEATNQVTSCELKNLSFVQTLTSGTDVKIEMSINVSNYTTNDFRELLSFIATSSREFYLTVAQKLNNKP